MFIVSNCCNNCPVYIRPDSDFRAIKYLAFSLSCKIKSVSLSLPRIIACYILPGLQSYMGVDTGGPEKF